MENTLRAIALLVNSSNYAFPKFSPLYHLGEVTASAIHSDSKGRPWTGPIAGIRSNGESWEYEIFSKVEDSFVVCEEHQLFKVFYELRLPPSL